MPTSRLTGTVCRWCHDRGFGFIRPDGETRDLFVHHSNINVRPEYGARVSFRVGVDRDGRPQATDARIEGYAGQDSEEIRPVTAGQAVFSVCNTSFSRPV